MSFGMPVDVLGTLSEKLKQMLNEAQDHYSSFLNWNQLYKDGKMDKKEYFVKITNYMVTISALNFLAIRVIVELKSALDKGTSIKGISGGMVSGSQQAGFGIDAFVGGDGTLGDIQQAKRTVSSSEQLPTFKPVDIHLPRRQNNEQMLRGVSKNKDCIHCGVTIPNEAKFCTKCGNSQQNR
ncbi:MAG: zinc ribbon domain-containing protein [Nitrososphaeraceae archaeon]|nr:zinc ribbon domain-containing protein [Nitrososphaeraceae archaeon]